MHRRYEVQSLPSTQEEQREAPRHELARRGYIKLPTAEVRRLLTDDCSTIREPGELPGAIKNAFATLTDEKPFSLAAPGTRFNATDVIEPGLPRRLLVLGGHCENRWFIEYEQGGIGKTVALMVLRINPDQSVALVWGRQLKRPTQSLRQLRNMLNSNAFWEGPYFW
jgi:hypothetical protein